MTSETRERIGVLLQEALELLDTHREAFAAIHVSHALECLGYVLNDPDDGPRIAAAGT